MARLFSSSIEYIDIPNTVKKIGEDAFSYCGKLTNVSLPEGLEEIEKYAFLRNGPIQMTNALKDGLCNKAFISLNTPIEEEYIIENVISIYSDDGKCELSINPDNKMIIIALCKSIIFINSYS